MRPLLSYNELGWATNIGYSSTPGGTAINKAAPLPGDTRHDFTRLGVYKTTRMPMEYYNWQLSGPAPWFKYLDSQYGKGDVYTTSNNEVSSTIEDKLPGVFVLIGTKLLDNNIHTIQYWRRTDTPQESGVRPTISNVVNYYPWATDDTVEVLATPAGQITVDNKRAPLPEHTSYGLKYNEPITSPEFNYLMDGNSQWFKYLDGRYDVGSTRMTISEDTEENISIRWGGTWTEVGTETINGQVIRMLRKVSEDEIGV